MSVVEDPAKRIRPPSRTRQRHPLILRSALSLLLILGAWMLPGPAAAGTNQGGMLVLHANPSLIFSSDSDYNGYSELYNCEDAITRIDGPPGEVAEVVYFVIAAFDGFAWPRIKALVFGIEHSSPLIEPISWGTSANFYVQTNSWPASLSGIGLQWSQPLTNQVNEVCWFACYAYDGNEVEIIDHPNLGRPTFADDSVPPEKDEVESLGRLGFGRDGYNPCGEDAATGACCTPQGRCIIQTRSTCEAFGYTYRGDNTVCWPNPCVPGEGACCLGIDCRLLKWDECLDAGGVFMGEGVSCDPSPCEFSQVETSWSKLKTIYREDW